ncbi:MAG: response regulator transcription factor [Lachnospiraceae bacterium]|jgi:DNA-binding LytR/AlgR family response regulator|nr:response regulator transcription factor [Lachnospiraceae bacterium]
MPCRVAICDDDKNQLNSLQSVIEKWGRISGSPCEVSAFPSAEAFLFAYEEDKHWDILLLDVEMEGMSGMGLARRVRQDNLRAEIIFVTSHFEFVSEGYEVDALHYLTKPVPEDKLMEVLDKAGERLAAEPPSQVITCEGETVKLYERDILYVESFRHYISIHTKDREYKIKENISAFEERLRGGFFRIHRSYLVNLKYVIRIGRTAVTVEGGEELPLARGRYDQVNRAFIQEN